MINYGERSILINNMVHNAKICTEWPEKDDLSWVEISDGWYPTRWEKFSVEMDDAPKRWGSEPLYMVHLMASTGVCRGGHTMWKNSVEEAIESAVIVFIEKDRR